MLSISVARHAGIESCRYDLQVPAQFALPWDQDDYVAGFLARVQEWQQMVPTQTACRNEAVLHVYRRGYRDAARQDSAEMKDGVAC